MAKILNALAAKNKLTLLQSLLPSLTINTDFTIEDILDAMRVSKSPDTREWLFSYLSENLINLENTNLFWALSYANTHPELFEAVLKNNRNLLQRNNNNETIFTLCRHNVATSRILTAHIRELVRQKKIAGVIITHIPVEQMQQLSFILEHCSEIHFLTLEVSQDIGDDPLYRAGINDFLSQYDGIQYQNILEAPISIYINKLEFRYRMTEFIQPGLATSQDETYIQHRTFIRGRAEREAAVRLAEQQERERVQAERDALRVEAARIQEEKIRAQAVQDIQNDLPTHCNTLLEILTEVTDIMNARDVTKKRVDNADSVISLLTFMTTYIFAIIGAVNADSEVEEGYPNVNNMAIALLVFYAEFFIKGIVDGLYTPLQFKDLSQETQVKITDLMTALEPSGLQVEIEPNCDVNELLDVLTIAMSNAAQRVNAAVSRQMHGAPSQIQQENVPQRINYNWSHLGVAQDRKLTEIWGFVLVVQFILSAIAYKGRPYLLPNILASFLITLGAHPGHQFGYVIQDSAQKLTLRSKDACTNTVQGMTHMLQNCFGSNRNQGSEMRSMTQSLLLHPNNHQQQSRMEEGLNNTF